MLGAMASEELVRRFGTTRVVAGGLVIMTATMPLVLLWEMNTSYLAVGPIVAVIALGVGLVFAPAAEAVMGAVGAAKAGVGSAMNDVTQMLAARSVSPWSGRDVCDLRCQARGCCSIAARRGGRDSTRFNRGRSPAGGDAVTRRRSRPTVAAKSAFTDALGLAVLIGAAFSLVGVLIVAKFMPARQEPLPEARPEAVPVRTDK